MVDREKIYLKKFGSLKNMSYLCITITEYDTSNTQRFLLRKAT